MNLRISSCFLALFLAAACAAPPPSTSSSPGSSKSEKNKNGQDDADDEDEGEPAAGNNEPATEPTDELEMKDFLMPDLINTGFTGGTEVFKVPLFTDLTGALTWEVADPSLAEVTPIQPPADYLDAKNAEPTKVPDIQFAMLTTKKAGASKVLVKGAGKTAEAQLTVKAYTSAAYAVGQTRYKTAADGARQPCAGCHEKPDGADHSPSWLALFDDDDVLSAIQTGVYAVDKYEVNGGNHKWNLSEEEKGGIMAYLRGLAPRGF
jgi:hypothetical protein